MPILRRQNSAVLPAELHHGDLPVLQMWNWNCNGTISGHVYGRVGFTEGELMTTSTVRTSSADVHDQQGSREYVRKDSTRVLAAEACTIVTRSGTKYLLGTPRSTAMTTWE
mmetsp:Transcript_559/g.1645  ORF Transcript_559/g.1645 Transcript_559/m.1645 type:complete len:111 (+) Transcript_559:377-709(+)